MKLFSDEDLGNWGAPRFIPNCLACCAVRPLTKPSSCGDEISDTAEEQIYWWNDDMHHIEYHFALLIQTFIK